MSQSSTLTSLLGRLQDPVKRSVFVSYHHHGDQAYYDAFVKAFDATYDILSDNSLERQVDSDDTNYVLQRIRDTCVKGSSCTIVLCGSETPWRKYVDWEIKATLEMEHGVIGVNLPTNQTNSNGRFTVPDRLYDNIQSAYAVWTSWADFTASTGAVLEFIEQAIAKAKNTIVNNREMMSRNGTPPWRT